MAKLRAMNWCCIVPGSVQVLAAKCCKYRAILRQILRSLEFLPANGQNIVHRYFHRGVFTKTCFYTGVCTYTCMSPQKVLHANTFPYKCFGTGMLLHKKLLHADARVLQHTDAFTQQCCYRGMLSHAFTQGFLWHKIAFTRRNFYSKYSSAEMLLHRKYMCTFFFSQMLLQRGFFWHEYFHGEGEMLLHTSALRLGRV